MNSPNLQAALVDLAMAQWAIDAGDEAIVSANDLYDGKVVE